MSDFLTDNNIMEFFRIVNPLFELTDIPAFVRSAAYQEILARTDNEWKVSTDTIYVDGRGDKWVYCPTLPIVTLTGLTIIAKNTEETTLIVDQTDIDRQIWYDPNTGKIEIIAPITGIEWNSEETSVFREGVNNVKLEGSFGTTSYSSILTIIQLYTMMRLMARVDPKTYGVADMVSETIGKYSYQLYGKSTSPSTRMTLDQILDYLYGTLPNNIIYDAI